uniref:Uncharacterized protein n=1 Tax=Vespula pensylvanica TaxID=30213 RepID=A0A834KU83_VESPE|nr:hypothetical protein H0235_012957 [Vespula pensylvanica]
MIPLMFIRCRRSDELDRMDWTYGLRGSERNVKEKNTVWLNKKEEEEEEEEENVDEEEKGRSRRREKKKHESIVVSCASEFGGLAVA